MSRNVMELILNFTLFQDKTNIEHMTTYYSSVAWNPREEQYKE
jgi:hypothetical protein